MLEYYQEQENVFKQQLAELEKRLLKEKKHLNFLYKEHKNMLVSREQEQQKTIDLTQLAILEPYHVYLHKQINHQEEVIFELTQKTEEAKEKTRKAMQDRKTLEALKDNDYVEHAQKINSMESKLIDEVMIGNYIRNIS